MEPVKRRNTQPCSFEQNRGQDGASKCESKPKAPDIYLEDEVMMMDPDLPEIHKVILKGDIDLLKGLVEGGADVNAPDPDGWPPLHTAIKNSQLECASYLIKHGASDFFERQQEEYLRRLNKSGRIKSRFYSM